MITNKIIQQEMDELKHTLKQGDFDIPSMWTCIWPGGLLVIWCEMCAFISYFISGKGRYFNVEAGFSFAFCFVMGVILGVGLANGRATFLSVPHSFRCNSKVYSFFSTKLKAYGIFFLFLVLSSSVFFGILGFGDGFPISLLVIVVFIGMIMSVDFSRYQLSLLTSTIETFKGDKK
ncbi:MAG: conjugal transfer protein TraS [Hafnia alvei]|uniref:conjugal transfer protein TraS n=1 Tax=Hafnia alvei TaxID=569 RepID=UPI0029151066|nr:conjugal transfer protein TraS [Hafnia alvei]MDU7483705.1 conjugal transfer protein TraS [Hafnia alvei]